MKQSLVCFNVTKSSLLGTDVLMNPTNGNSPVLFYWDHMESLTDAMCKDAGFRAWATGVANDALADYAVAKVTWLSFTYENDTESCTTGSMQLQDMVPFSMMDGFCEKYIRECLSMLYMKDVLGGDGDASEVESMSIVGLYEKINAALPTGVLISTVKNYVRKTLKDRNINDVNISVAMDVFDQAFEEDKPI